MAPPGLLVATVMSASWIDLSWGASADPVDSYQLQLSADGVTFSLLVTVGAPGTSYSHTGLTDTTTYWYRVRAVQGTRLSAFSNVVSATSLVGNHWRMMGQNAQHTGHASSESGVPPLSPAWSRTLSTGALNPVSVESGRVFVSGTPSGTSDRAIWGLNAANGATLWSYNFGAVFSVGHPAVHQGEVFVQQCDHTPGTFLWKFNASSGAMQGSWAFSAQWENYWSPIVVGSRVYINGGYYGGMYGFDRSTGTQLFFNNSLEQYDEWSPSYHEGTLYSFVAGNLRVHDPDTGTIQATVAIPWNWAGWSMETVPVFEGTHAYIVTPPSLHSVDLVTRTVDWSTTAFSYTGTPAVADGVVYALSGGTLHARDAETGALLWSFVGDRKLSYPPVVVNNHVYLSSDTRVYAVSLATRASAWSAATAGWLAVAEGRLYVARADGTLDAFSLSPGTLPLPAPAPTAPTGLSALAGGIGRIDLAWTDASSNESGFRIERSVGGGPFSLLTALGANATTFMDVGLNAAVTYSYRVSAVNDAGPSGYSNVASALPPALGDAWAMQGRDAAHAGENPLAGGTPPVSLAWAAPLAAVELRPVSVEGNQVFVTAKTYFGPSSYLRALDASTGAVQWSYDFGSVKSVNPPSVSRGRVYVQQGNQTPGSFLYAFNAYTGEPLWASPFGAQWPEYWSPTIVGDRIYINGGYYGGLYGFDGASGAQLFFNGTLEQYDEWTPAYHNGNVYSFVAGNLRAHHETTGATLWTATVPWTWAGWSMRTCPVFGPSLGYVIAPPNLHAINPATQSVQWSTTGGSFAGAPAYAGGVVYAITGGALEARDAATGAFLWTFPAASTLSFPPVVAAGHVYVSSTTATYAVNIGTQAQVWSAMGGGWLTLAGGRLYAAGTDGTLRAYTLGP